MNPANQPAQYMVNGNDGTGCIFSKFTQLDNQYSLYYTNDENKVYLYDKFAGTYN